MRNSTVDDQSPFIEAYSFLLYGRKGNGRIFGVEAEPDENVFGKVVSVAEETGVAINANNDSTRHRVPTDVMAQNPQLPCLSGGLLSTN